MRQLIGLALAALTVCGMIGSAGAEEAEIGAIKTLQGSAFIERAGSKQAAELGASLQQNDVIETGQDGSVGITFKDNTIISVGPDTSLTLDKFVYVPAEQKYSFVTRMARGTMFYASGVIAKLSPQSVSVVTPVGTIGIRGTRFLVKLDQTH